MALQEFLAQIASQLSVGQKQALTRFLQASRSGRLPTDPTAIEHALERSGELLPMPDLEPTTPEGYNQAFQTLLANIAGLYQELDHLESIHDALDDLNRTELDRIETGIRDLVTILTTTESAFAENTQYSDVFFETFGPGTEWDRDPSWYRPIASTGLPGVIESYLPLQVDPEDHALKLTPGGDFSRTVSAAGLTLVQVELDEILGLSVDHNHGVPYCVDRRYHTFWRELILSEAPIQADPLQVPWLPITYQAGAAARLHFRWPFAVPFTEIVLRPFAKFPIKVLQVVWDNRKIFAANRILNPEFASGGLHWTVGHSSGAVITYPTNGGWRNKSHVNIVITSGRVTLTSQTFTASGFEFAYHLTAKVYRTPDADLQFQVIWKNPGGGETRTDSFLPDVPCNDWYEVSKLFIAPSGWTISHKAEVRLIVDGSGSVKMTEVRFSPTVGALNFDQSIDLESDSLVVPLDNANGTDVWIVVAQPHYEFLQVALPEGEIDKQTLWEEIRIAAEARGDSVQRSEQTPWLFRSLEKDLPSRAFPSEETDLTREVQRLGGRLRAMVMRLMEFVHPSPNTRNLNRYMYVLGAWEINIRHREYAPAGLFVSLPYKPRGEARELILLTDPPLSELSDRIRFWVTARRDDRGDKAKRLTGRATFSSSTERPGYRSDTHFTLPPVTRREVFDGTDRNNRIALEHHPYIDRDRIWTLQTRLTSGALSTPLTYDPNKEVIYFTNTQGDVEQVPGYRPIRVTLEFSDGTVARGDVLGKIQKGDIGLQEKEILQPATVEQEISQLGEDALRRIDQRLQRVPAANRDELLQRLVREELRRQALRESRESRKSLKTIQVTAFRTRFPKIISGPAGVNLTLYWHRSQDDKITNKIITSGDVLINRARYTVDPINGVIILRDTPPQGDLRYDSVIAYYYYERDEIAAREVQESRTPLTLPTSGVDFSGSFSQSLPITRNMTDYIRGETRSLRPAVLDPLDPSYYPVYEYIQDERGRLIFANNLSRFSNQPARVIVEYESLEIEPRLIIEITPGAVNEFTTKTPRLDSYTLLMNSRR